MTKLIKIFFSYFIFSLLFSAASTASPWVDNWTNGSYYLTNGENKNFRSFLLRSEGRFGVQPDENFSAAPYFVYYLNAGQDPNYWNNNIAYGVGLRVKPFTGYQSDTFPLDLVKDIKFYGEVLGLAFLKDEQTAVSNEVTTNDFRFGLDIWHEWGLKDGDDLTYWGELWANLGYRSTNFYDKVNFTKFQTYVGYLQLKGGQHIGNGIKPYLAIYSNSSGSSKAWLNNFMYGGGIRFEPFMNDLRAPAIFQKFKMYVEYLSIILTADQDPTRPNYDLRFGVEMTQGR